MMKMSGWLLSVAGLLVLFHSPMSAQTDGSATLHVTTARTYQNYDPKHVLAIWVTDSSNQFVKTLKKMAGSREQYLYTWRAIPNRNTTDAITGATIGSHQSHTVTWDCRDTSGNVVPDGKYRIRVEFTTRHAQGPLTPTSHLEFTKGPDEVSLSPADLQYFKNMSLTYRPDLETNVLVAAESSWKFNDKGVDLHGTGWNLLDYDDSSWGEGPGKLGYSDSPATLLSYGPSSSNKYRCYYFRHEFEAAFIPVSLRIGILRDDGAVVYLNGKPVAYSNMAEGPTAYNDYALETAGGSEEDTYFQIYIDPADLVVGKNILAAEVHQAEPDSSDLAFDLELKAGPPAVLTPFLRGDVDATGDRDLSDAIAILSYLFLEGNEPDCLSSADANDDDAIDIADVLKFLWSRYIQGTPLPPPYEDCGTDPTPGGLSCKSYPCGE